MSQSKPKKRAPKRVVKPKRVHRSATALSGLLVRWFNGLVIALCTFVLVVVSLGFFISAQGPLSVPQLRGFLEEELNNQTPETPIAIGGLDILPGDRGLMSAVGIRDFAVRDKAGEVLAIVPNIRADFSLSNLFKGKFRPKQMVLDGTQIQIERDVHGQFNFLSGMGNQQMRANLFETADEILRLPSFERLEEIRVDHAQITYRDALSGRRYLLDDGQIKITRDGDALSVQATVQMEGEEGDLTKLLFSANRNTGDQLANLRVQFDDADPKDVASQVDALSWMSTLDVPVSGSIVFDSDQTGSVATLNGVVSISEGQVFEELLPKPIDVQNTKIYFAYSAAREEFTISNMQIETSVGRILGAGKAFVARRDGRAIKDLVAQLQFDTLSFNDKALFDVPVRIGNAAIDVKVSLNPLRIEVGQISGSVGFTQFIAKGALQKREDRWTTQFEVSADALREEDVLALWPKGVASKTRNWIDKNIANARLTRIVGRGRIDGGKPEFELAFDASDVTARFMKFLPMMERTSGRGILTNNTVRLMAQSGVVPVEGLGEVQIGGTEFYISDFKQRPAPAQVLLKANGPLPVALNLVNQAPLNLLNKAGLPERLAEGQADVVAEFKFPLRKGVKIDAVDITVQAALRDVSSEVLVKGKSLVAKVLNLTLDNDAVQISGEAQYEGVPVNAVWSKTLGAKPNADSRVDVVATVDQASLKKIGVTLPKGFLRGKTRADLRIDLTKGSAPKFVVTSNLQGVDLRLPSLGWRKSSKARGAFEISGQLGDRVSVDQLSLKAAGLEAKGNISLDANGKFAKLTASKLTLGNWLDVTGVVSGTGKNARVSVTSGRVDMRRANLGGGAASSSGGGSTPLNLKLDRLVVTSGLTLRSFTADLRGGRGKFKGRVNGGAGVSGTITPDKNGSRVRIVGQDAARVLRDAGLFSTARDGTLEVTLVPTPTKGNYDGQFEIQNVRVKTNKALSLLVNAASVIGLLQQLDGSGLHFLTVEGGFQIRPEGVKLNKISAVGPSTGLTASGWYNSARKTIDLEGVFTPVYIANGVLERLFGKIIGRGKGEGLFSFTYRMKGAAADPKVSVNPFSILTPGVFREIFRRDVPKPAS